MYAQRRWIPPGQQKSLTDKGSLAEAKGKGGVSARRVQMTRGGDETQPTRLLRPEHLWQRQCTVAQQLEYRVSEVEKTPTTDPFFLLGESATHEECSFWGARYLARGVVVVVPRAVER